MFLDNTFKKRTMSALFIVSIIAYPIYLGGATLFLLNAILFLLCLFEIICSTKKPTDNAALKLFLIFYVIIGSASFINIRINHGLLVTVWVILVTCLADTFALIGGKLFGGLKMVPKISPNKTWSGFFCGIIASAVFSYFFGVYTGQKLLRNVLFCFSMAIISVIGDLIISASKRKLGIKDFSNIIPGHGGVLDRLDSLLLTASFTYLLFKIIEN